MKRRKFLAISLGTATVTVAGTASCSQISDLPKQARSRYQSRRYLNQSPTGEISRETLDVLKATAAAIIGFEITDFGRYESFFKWKAKHYPGYKELYESFTASVIRTARERGESNFLDMDRESQLKIIDRHKLISSSQIPGRLGALSDMLFKRNEMLYESFLFGEILTLFARTQALTMIGYDRMIGTPRGLESYQQKMIG